MIPQETWVRAGMSVKSIIRRCGALALAPAIRVAVRHSPSRSLLNHIYNNLLLKHQREFHRLFKNCFYDKSERVTSGVWSVAFAGKRIQIPLRSGSMWLDWKAAVGVSGHDADVKAYYQRVLTSSKRPDIFLDIGANYGLSSLIFLAHGIETITFEPNPECINFFKRYCAENGCMPRIECVALGEHDGQADLVYPEHETWLGSTNTDTAERLRSTNPLLRCTVPLKPLDFYSNELSGKHLLIKIDTEGSELAIIRGAKRILLESKCAVIFEAWNKDARSPLFALLSDWGYSIRLLQQPDQAGMSLPEFLQASGGNFLALVASLCGAA
jgi:FkbM family methyltransferase